MFSIKAAAAEIHVGSIVSDCPGVAAVRESFETPNSIWMAMDYIENATDLVDFMAKDDFRPMDEMSCKYLFKSIAFSLLRCHQRCVAHRDIKLDNILVDMEGIPVIIDFGLSICMRRNSTSGDRCVHPCGSPEYVAPEQLLATSYCPFKADTWSLGIVLYAMLFGQFPFASMRMDDGVGNQIVDQSLCWTDEINGASFHVSMEAKDLITMMLDTNPDTRCDMEAVVRHPWLKDDEV